MEPFKALDVACEIAGSTTALAKRLGLVQGAVSNWRIRKRIPAEYCPAIERLTAGQVRCEHLRPDIDWDVLIERGAVTRASGAGLGASCST